MTDDDHGLYQSFRALRREEQAQVPPIPNLLPAAREPGRRRFAGPFASKLAAATACLATMIAAALWLWPGSRLPHERLHPEQQPTAISITSWKPATDFLLDTPGRGLLQAVPAIGEWHPAVMAPASAERHHPFSKTVSP